MIKLDIIRSESWCHSAPISEINEILNEAIGLYLEDSDKIINIQVVESGERMRFWIYFNKFEK